MSSLQCHEKLAADITAQCRFARALSQVQCAVQGCVGRARLNACLDDAVRSVHVMLYMLPANSILMRVSLAGPD